MNEALFVNYRSSEWALMGLIDDHDNLVASRYPLTRLRLPPWLCYIYTFICVSTLTPRERRSCPSITIRGINVLVLIPPVSSMLCGKFSASITVIKSAGLALCLGPCGFFGHSIPFAWHSSQACSHSAMSAARCTLLTFVKHRNWSSNMYHCPN